MAHKTSRDTRKRAKLDDQAIDFGRGGDTHQTAGEDLEPLTTQQGVPVADDQNSLRIGARGPTALEDFHFREKIFHFDHERIPERVVHARGFGAHGYLRELPIAGRPHHGRPLSASGREDSALRALLHRGRQQGLGRPGARCARLCGQALYQGKATGTSSATTFRCSSSRMRSSFPISSTPRSRSRIAAFRRRRPRTIISGTSSR